MLWPWNTRIGTALPRVLIPVQWTSYLDAHGDVKSSSSTSARRYQLPRQDRLENSPDQDLQHVLFNSFNCLIIWKAELQQEMEKQTDFSSIDLYPNQLSQLELGHLQSGARNFWTSHTNTGA